MTSLQFLLIALAVFRVSYMVAIEEGPFSIFHKIREKIDPNQKTSIGRGLNCPMCVSFWVSILAALVWATGAFETTPGLVILLALGASALTVITILFANAIKARR